MKGFNKRLRFEHTLVGDFETTVYDGQKSTEVWASGLVELFTEDCVILHSINETFEWLKYLQGDTLVYYHNLKFDGTFWVDYLMNGLHFKQALYKSNKGNYKWYSNYDMPINSFKFCVSSMGYWYTITIRTEDKFIEIRDSLKLLPFSVEKIGKSFKTKHQKLEMEYTGYRYAGCVITDEEKEYLKNDLLVVKEALEIMYKEGHNGLTIGSCCLSEFKRKTGAYSYDELFPQLDKIKINEAIYGAPNADKYIRKSYRGGWCYAVEQKTGIEYDKGITADVNSLYPSMMHSRSGNVYPYGLPHFWYGNYIDDEALVEDRYFFVRIKCRFKIKKNMLPFIQLKGNPLYKSTEMLKTSDVYNPKTNEYSRYYTKDGEVCDSIVEMTLTKTDYYLFLKHYEVMDLEILDGCWFNTIKGIFDEYIDHYAKIKMTSKGAIRELAKLFLNNLYGKLASSDDSSFKYAYLREDGSVGFLPCEEHEKKTGYIACGSAITSYARAFTITAAQANYYGADKPGFIYADTDSIHCNLSPQELKGITVHDSDFCCWKLEATWDYGLFVRQKTYIEHVVEENLEPIEKPFYNVKCAGMPQRCKNYFIQSVKGDPITEKQRTTLSEDAIKFIETPHKLSDFTRGLVIPGKLMPKRIKGGTLLVDTTYEMR